MHDSKTSWSSWLVKSSNDQRVFLANLAFSIGLCVAGVAGFIYWNNNTKLIIQPIQKVVQVSRLPQITDVAKPISEIRPGDNRELLFLWDTKLVW